MNVSIGCLHINGNKSLVGLTSMVRHYAGLTRSLPNPNNIQPDQYGRFDEFKAKDGCKRICYFRMQAQQANSIRLCQVDGNLCTHVVLAFARLDSRGGFVLEHREDLAYLQEVREFKRLYPHCKVLISVFHDSAAAADHHNEPNQHDSGFSMATSTPENRLHFAKCAMDFLKHYHLDGLDLDWELANYTTPFTGGREQERNGLIKLIKTLRSAIVENFYARQVTEQQQQNNHNLAARQQIYSSNNNCSTTVEPYILTVAVTAQEATLKANCELKQVANLCDWLHIMSFDYFTFKPYAPFTGPNSPLHSIVDPYVPILCKFSLAWTLNKLVEDEIPNEKIVMGIPTYARAYKLMFKNSQPAPFTLAVGSRGSRFECCIDYREVCEVLKRPDTIVGFDLKARVPYLLTDDGYTWITYENTQSVCEKVRFIIENNLAGYMTWTLNSDNFHCIQSLNGITTSNQQQQQQNEAVDSNAFKHSSEIVQQVTFPLHRAMYEEARLISESCRKSAD